MGGVDRTPEFRQFVSDLIAKGEGPKDGLDETSYPQQSQSELNAWSADIGSGIHNTSLKVQELRKKAKQKGIFKDQTPEINELTTVVTGEIQVLSQKIESLERKVAGVGQNGHHKVHTKTLVQTLATRLSDVRKEFQDALEDRMKAIDHQHKRQQLYGSGAGSGVNPFASKQRPCADANDPEGGGGGGQTMSMATSYHHSRAQAVEHVQKTIGELAQIFQKMAVMVHSQEEMIQRIDQDLDATALNVDEGQQHLLKYFQYMSSNRGLILKVFLILIFFVIFFVIFLA